MIQSIKIEKLFDIFDYDISFQSEENILIITGPNGFGKTKILNIIYSLFKCKFLFFKELVFKKIIISLDFNSVIEIAQITEKNKKEIIFKFLLDKEELGFFNLDDVIEQVYTDDKAEPHASFGIFDEDGVFGSLSSLKSADEIFNHYGSHSSFSEAVTKKILSSQSKTILQILNSIKVHFVREQRLFKKVINQYGETSTTFTPEMILAHANELKQRIAKNDDIYGKTSRELDGTYPKRLMSETENLTIEQFKNRFNILKEKQHKLKVFGISDSEQEVSEYSEKNATALLVYLKDSEKKISVFDDLVGKLELFTSILNERRLTFKSIKIIKDKGFIFVTDKGKELKLTDLSSGEQHEVVLLFELIFNTKENTVLLIDEPEISLHITWQKEFVKDLIKIIKLQKIQVIIATHAPSIINDRWDLVYSLDKAGV